MEIHRRDLLKIPLAAAALQVTLGEGQAFEPAPPRDLTITRMKVTPIALPDPPILASGGCHGPYFLRNVVEVQTDAGIVGWGETHGSQRTTAALEKMATQVVGRSAFAYRGMARSILAESPAAYAGFELACLDATGKATGRRVCELLGGPVRDSIEFSAYLFYRFAADDRRVLADARIADGRGRGEKALDAWGEVRTPEAMVRLAEGLRERWGFRVLKLKAGVLPPDVELETMRALHSRFQGQAPLRIDPNARWTLPTAVRIGKALREVALEYYEDPVAGQEAMAEVRRSTGLKMSTNMCVTRFAHIPAAIRTEPVDVVLCDHHGWGGIPACQALGTLCDGAGWRLSQHSNSHAGITLAGMVHLAAATPQLEYASDTHYPWLVDDADILAGTRLAIKDGHIQVPSGPGLGVEVDRDTLARAHEVFRKCGMRDRDDAATMRMIDPDWRRELL